MSIPLAFLVLSSFLGESVMVNGDHNPTAFEQPITDTLHHHHNRGRRLNNVPFEEFNGVVVMEMESQPVIPDWKFETDVPGYTGTGYCRMDGNKVSRGSPNGRTSFFIKINFPGTYTLAIRSNKNNEDSTLSNDCYTKMVGYPGYQGDDVKTYMFGPSNTWSWSTTHQINHHDHRQPSYFLDVGVYELQVSGRSKNFFIDRIVLFNNPVYSRSKATNLEEPESLRSGMTPDVYAVIDTNFTAIDGFSFKDDTFRGTSNPAYSAGWWSSATNKLRITLGGRDDNEVNNISGGYETTFALDAMSDVLLQFKYKVIFNSGLDDGEDVEVLCSVDGVLYGKSWNVDYVAKFDGNTTDPPTTTGFRTAYINLRRQAEGVHDFVIGGLLSKKDSKEDFIRILVDEVYVVAYHRDFSAPTPAPTMSSMPTSSSSPTVNVPKEEVLMDDDFNTDVGGFVYKDNVFRDAKEWYYAKGWWSTETRKLKITLGGRDNEIAGGMSGGYRKSYTLKADASDVVISFRYRVTFQSTLEEGENFEVLCSVDGQLYGIEGTDAVDAFYGGVDSSSPAVSTGWKLATVRLGTQLVGGPYMFAVGGHLSMKNGIEDEVILLVDDMKARAEYI